MERYRVGELVTVMVTGIVNYGIFVRLPDGAQGLIHISEISDSYVRDVNSYAEVGATVEAVVIGYGDRANYKLSLKRKAKRARQTPKGPIKPPLRREANREKLDSIPFAPLAKILESQIAAQYDMLPEAEKDD